MNLDELRKLAGISTEKKTLNENVIGAMARIPALVGAVDKISDTVSNDVDFDEESGGITEAAGDNISLAAFGDAAADRDARIAKGSELGLSPDVWYAVDKSGEVIGDWTFKGRQGADKVGRSSFYGTDKDFKAADQSEVSSAGKSDDAIDIDVGDKEVPSTAKGKVDTTKGGFDDEFDDSIDGPVVELPAAKYREVGDEPVDRSAKIDAILANQNVTMNYKYEPDDLFDMPDAVIDRLYSKLPPAPAKPEYADTEDEDFEEYLQDDINDGYQTNNDVDTHRSDDVYAPHSSKAFPTGQADNEVGFVGTTGAEFKDNPLRKSMAEDVEFARMLKMAGLSEKKSESVKKRTSLTESAVRKCVFERKEVDVKQKLTEAYEKYREEVGEASKKSFDNFDSERKGRREAHDNRSVKVDNCKNGVRDTENQKKEEICEENVYQENGYQNRKDYLKSLSEDLGVDIKTVYALASILGPDEDFDGLVTSLEDYADGM